MIRAVLLPLLVLIWANAPAAAHGLRVFAATEGDRVSGYGFFIGGGRVRAAPWSARIGAEVIAEGRTDGDGRFAFALPDPAPHQSTDSELTVSIDIGDGHAATARISLRSKGIGHGAEPPVTAAAPPPDLEAALARQIAPLQAQIAALEARLRLVDLIAGLCLIAGLAGMALWARRR